MSLKFFITGTDTNIGKTYISVGLLKFFNQSGYSTLGIKPIATGCEEKNNKFYNSDALLLQDASSIKLAYASINPTAFKPPVAPHIAALKTGQLLSVRSITQKLQPALNCRADVFIIEGVGGWHVPLNPHETMADFAIQNQFSVIVVIGIRLGCLNHGILTYQAVKASGVNISGWIANCIEPGVLEMSEIIKFLKDYIKVPCLGKVGYQEKPEDKFDIRHIKRYNL
jgi:dethiobiotin synthetase